MKRMAVVLVSLMAVACNTPAKKDASPASLTDAGKPAQASTSTTTQPQTSGEGIPQQQSVYFDYGKADISAEFKAVILKEAESVRGNKNDAVMLEGNCDERGSSEYNLALGERRADAVKKLLVAAGVPGNQLKATSLGKEKPKLSCHEEKCWKENRRVDFVPG